MSLCSRCLRHDAKPALHLLFLLDILSFDVLQRLPGIALVRDIRRWAVVVTFASVTDMSFVAIPFAVVAYPRKYHILRETSTSSRHQSSKTHLQRQQDNSARDDLSKLAVSIVPMQVERWHAPRRSSCSLP